MWYQAFQYRFRGGLKNMTTTYSATDSLFFYTLRKASMLRDNFFNCLFNFINTHRQKLAHQHLLSQCSSKMRKYHHYTIPCICYKAIANDLYNRSAFLMFCIITRAKKLTNNVVIIFCRILECFFANRQNMILMMLNTLRR